MTKKHNLLLFTGLRSHRDQDRPKIMERSNYRSIGYFYLIPRNYQPILSENRNIAYSGS